MPDASDLDNPAAFIDRIIGGDTDAVDDPIAQIQKLDPGTPRQRTEETPRATIHRWSAPESGCG